MARCLIIGCGCRGRMLAAALIDSGHAVRGTTRHPERLAQIASTGAEPVVADPDRISTLTPTLEHVGVVCLLLGSAVGEAAQLEALHGSRLETLLRKMIDTTVRGVVYQARGAVDPRLLRKGSELVRSLCGDSLIPYALLEVDPADPAVWLKGATAAVDHVLGRS